MRSVNIPRLKHTKGDTWEGMNIGPVLFNTAQPPYALSSCRLYFRTSAGVVGYKYKSVPSAGEGTITIDDADTWEVTVEPGVLGLDVGVYSWDFETTDSDGVIRTLYRGELQIKEEQSYD